MKQWEHILFAVLFATACGEQNVTLSSSLSSEEGTIESDPTPSPTPTPIATTTPTPTATPTPTPTPTPNPNSMALYVDQTHANCQDESLPRELNNESTPWCEIYGANINHQSGDTVYIKPGEYREPILPQNGIDAFQHTKYVGLGNVDDIKILGSEVISGWQHHAGNVYKATFLAPIQCRRIYDGSTWQWFDVPNTMCWQDRSLWINRASEPTLANPGGGSIADLDEGEFYYDEVSQTLYVWPHGNGDPSNHLIECEKRDIASWTEYSDGWPNVPTTYVTIENLTITQTPASLRLDGRAHHFDIRGNVFAHTTGSGYCGSNPSAVYHGSNGSYVPHAPAIYITGNTFHHIGSDRGWSPDSSGPHSGSAIKLYDALDSTIEQNEIYDSPIGIEIKQGNANITVRQNHLYRIGGLGMRLALQLCHIQIEENILHDIDSTAIGILGATDHIRIRNNVFWDVVGGVRFYPEHGWSNPITCTDPDTGNPYTISNNITNTEVRNNIFGVRNGGVIFRIKDSGGRTTHLDNSDYNFFDTAFPAPRFDLRGTVLNLTQWNSADINGDGTSENNDTLSTVDDPQFINPPVDFHLHSGSNACTAGDDGGHVGAFSCP